VVRRIPPLTRVVLPLVAVATALAVSVIAKRQAPWIPFAYLAVFCGALIGAVALYWWRQGPLPWRVFGIGAATIVLVGLLPIPWMTVRGADPPGTAWRLDGRVVIDGTTIDPPGDWYWLTVGRPPTVAELVGSWAFGGLAPLDLRHGRDANRLRTAEPVAVAAGLAAAGEIRRPDELDVAVGGRLASTPLGSWYRSLALGRSHGLMVALVTYSHASGEDLARGRTIAGTGAVSPNGTVTAVGGLPSKARAAAAAGADMLLFPADQADELADFDPGEMELVGVASLDEAIAALRGLEPRA
jgi:hypothetical protein